MKQFILLTMLIFLIGIDINAQITDNRFKGVSVFMGNSYAGMERKITRVGEEVIFKAAFKSVKVYGAYKLVNVNNPSVAIMEDDPSFNLTGVWRLEETNETYTTIVYSESNYRGQAKFLKDEPGIMNLLGEFASLKTARPVKVGYYNATGLQKCAKGKVPSFDYNFTRIDIDWKHGKCASAGTLITSPN